jgi:tRNA A-37 threonylcarbamoyl transferase component Bud32
VRAYRFGPYRARVLVGKWTLPLPRLGPTNRDQQGTRAVLRAKQRLGKYRIERRLAEGAFANVYQALDTIEGIRVALKIPHAHLVTREVLEEFRNEVRLMAQLDHPNILPLKDASFVDSHFVIAFPLAERTLAERIQRRLSLRTALDFADQMLAAVAYAHAKRMIHCDIKPENFLLFPQDRLRLTDFGIAKVARRTVQASGSGTVGYIAPEQAMGKPSFRSDVFSLGLILYRMLSGQLPEWPYEWPPPGFDRLKQRAHPDLIQLVRKATEFQPRKRFQDAGQMRAAFRRAKTLAMKHQALRGRRKTGSTARRDWQMIRRQQFQREYGAALETRFACHRCAGPVAESMRACPWCGAGRAVHPEETRMPARCPRCKRGLKLDWSYCPWCYGPGFEVSTRRQYTDVRYQARCSNSACPRKALMPFMRYCPWCHRKVRRKWKVPGKSDTCPSCGWGVYRSFWDYCPWCGKALHRAVRA